MRAADVMETRVDVADSGTAAEEAWERMRRHSLDWLVVTERARIVGLVGRAALSAGGKARRQDRTLAAFVPREPVTIGADYPLARAITLLEGDVSGCVPVLERGRLVGVLTMTGLLRRFGSRESRTRPS